MRQMRLPQLGELGQRRLAAAKVAVICAGGLGAPVLSYLAAAGVGGWITVFDPDMVDVTNLHRQVLFTTASRLAAPRRSPPRSICTPRIPRSRVTPVVGVVTPATALEQLAGDDLVLDGTDNFPDPGHRLRCLRISTRPLVWGSILAFSGQVSAFWQRRSRGVTYRDDPRRRGPGLSCSEAGVLGMLCGVIGSSMAMEAVKVLAGRPRRALRAPGPLRRAARPLGLHPDRPRSAAGPGHGDRGRDAHVRPPGPWGRDRRGRRRGSAGPAGCRGAGDRHPGARGAGGRPGARRRDAADALLAGADPSPQGAAPTALPFPLG